MEAWSTQQNPPGDHLLRVERRNDFAFVKNPRCRKHLLGKAWHSHNLAKAACRSPQGLGAEWDTWKSVMTFFAAGLTCHSRPEHWLAQAVATSTVASLNSILPWGGRAPYLDSC